MDRYAVLSCDIKDEKYPREMRDVSGMPSIIYYRGNIEIINQQKSIALIGSRKSSAEGLRLSYEAGRIAAESGINVVNGLALGCDAEALKGALSVGGKCIVVMPCGLEQVVPKSNYRLAEEILEKGGCLISQYPVGTTVRDFQYVERDRLQSGLSQGVIIIEALEKSGTMHTAQFALQQYKRLACYYSHLVNGASGNKQLENRGKADVLKSQQDLKKFIQKLSVDQTFEQLTFDFSLDIQDASERKNTQ